MNNPRLCLGFRACSIAPVAALLTLLLWIGEAGAADEPSLIGPAAVAEVLAGDELRLADGRIVRLAGLRVPTGEAGDAGTSPIAEQARAELSTLLDGQSIRLAVAETAYDRYGRLVAQLERSDGLWLQGVLLEHGVAQVHTRPGEVARAARMLALEQKARTARRGLWAGPQFMARDAGAVVGDVGDFQVVYGRVFRVAPTERFVYLNFGADWRRDFTVRIAKKLARRLADSGLDVTTLAGRRVEIRGFVLEAGGPLIELSHAEQMQLLR
jgi:endonuclease YncB( thermonuclease family)